MLSPERIGRRRLQADGAPLDKNAVSRRGSFANGREASGCMRCRGGEEMVGTLKSGCVTVRRGSPIKYGIIMRDLLHTPELPSKPPECIFDVAIGVIETDGSVSSGVLGE